MLPNRLNFRRQNQENQDFSQIRYILFLALFKGGILVWDRAFFLIFTLEKTEIIFNFENKITNSANETLGIAIILNIMETLQVSSATLMILFMKMAMIARSSVYDTHGVSNTLAVTH